MLLGLALGGCGFELGPGDGRSAGRRRRRRDNLVGNPSFEDDLDNWHGSNAALTREPIADAPDGCCVARLQRDAGDSSAYYGIDDDDPVVAAAEPGASYRASAWVRLAADVAGPPRTARIFLRQGAALEQIAASPDLTLSTSFQSVETTAAALCSGGVIDVHISQADPLDGDAFDVDLVEVVAPAAAPAGACP